MANQIEELINVPVEFWNDGVQFSKRCTKPDRDEFIKMCTAVGTGFIIAGTVGYLVKLIHVPLNNVLVAGA